MLFLAYYVYVTIYKYIYSLIYDDKIPNKKILIVSDWLGHLEGDRKQDESYAASGLVVSLDISPEI